MTRSGVYITTQLAAHIVVLEWAGLLAGDVGDWMLLAHYGDKCLHVYGVFGGASVGLDGSNEDIPTNPFPMTDPQQTALAVTAVVGKQVLENPLKIRPKITGGDGTTNLTVRLVCRQ